MPFGEGGGGGRTGILLRGEPERMVFEMRAGARREFEGGRVLPEGFGIVIRPRAGEE